MDLEKLLVSGAFRFFIVARFLVFCFVKVIELSGLFSCRVSFSNFIAMLVVNRLA